MKGLAITSRAPVPAKVRKPQAIAICWRARAAVYAICAFTSWHGPATAEAMQETASSADPIGFVAPELRENLRKYQQMMPSSKPGSISATNLAGAREQGRRYEAPFLPEPAVRELMVPGPDGAPDVRVYLIGAGAGASRPAILHVHGGGFVTGSPRGDVARLQALARRHDCVIASVDYRLAPETAFPGSLEDNYAALKWLFTNATTLGVDASRIAVMGESAGGGHAAMLALAARDRKEIPLVKQILVYPMLDDRTGTTVAVPDWIGHYVWNPESNRFGWSSLLGMPAGSASVPPGSVPARVDDLSSLPPAFIAVGSVDLFVDEDIEYARRLIAAGVPTELLVVPGAFHGFQMMVPESGLAVRFNAAIDEAIRRGFGQ